MSYTNILKYVITKVLEVFLSHLSYKFISELFQVYISEGCTRRLPVAASGGE